MSKWNWRDLGVSPEMERQMVSAREQGVRLTAPPESLVLSTLRSCKEQFMATGIAAAPPAKQWEDRWEARWIFDRLLAPHVKPAAVDQDAAFVFPNTNSRFSVLVFRNQGTEVSFRNDSNVKSVIQTVRAPHLNMDIVRCLYSQGHERGFQQLKRQLSNEKIDVKPQRLSATELNVLRREFQTVHEHHRRESQDDTQIVTTTAHMNAQN